MRASLFQINRLAAELVAALIQLFDNAADSDDCIVELNDQQIIVSEFVFCYAFYLVEDRTYPAARPSSGTAGDGQLHDPFFGKNRAANKKQKNGGHKYRNLLFHQRTPPKEFAQIITQYLSARKYIFRLTVKL